jgi:hypothetical protein
VPPHRPPSSAANGTFSQPLAPAGRTGCPDRDRAAGRGAARPQRSSAMPHLGGLIMEADDRRAQRGVDVRAKRAQHRLWQSRQSTSSGTPNRTSACANARQIARLVARGTTLAITQNREWSSTPVTTFARRSTRRPAPIPASRIRTPRGDVTDQAAEAIPCRRSTGARLSHITRHRTGSRRLCALAQAMLVRSFCTSSRASLRSARRAVRRASGLPASARLGASQRQRWSPASDKRTDTRGMHSATKSPAHGAEPWLEHTSTPPPRWLSERTGR